LECEIENCFNWMDYWHRAETAFALVLVFLGLIVKWSM